MTNEQFLLLKLAEECTEIAHVAMKTVQFGYSSVAPGQSLTNIQHIHNELDDLLGICQMLNDECSFAYEPNDDAIIRKVKKVQHFRSMTKGLDHGE